MKNTNPKFTFWKLMYQFLVSREFIDIVAERLVEMQKEHGAGVLGIETVTFDELKTHHSERYDFGAGPVRTDFVDDLIGNFFEAMAQQVRSGGVQDLIYSYSHMDGFENTLMVRARKIDLVTGDYPMAVITLVVNDWRLWVQSMGATVPEKFWGHSTPPSQQTSPWFSWAPPKD